MKMHRRFTKCIAPLLVASLTSAASAALNIDYQTNANENYAFTLIANPSAADFGNGKTTALHPDSPVGFQAGFGTPNGTPSSLNNGLTAGNSEAVFAGNASTNDFQYYFDLGSKQNITQINAYSFNTDSRAPVSFTVWGTNNPALIAAGGAGNGGINNVNNAYNTLAAKGWTEIVGVGSPTLANRTSGVQITDSTGSLGQFQYLLFSARPNVEGTNTHPFIKEIDIYTGSNAQASNVSNVPITNHSFENGITGWTVTGGTANFADTGATTVNWAYPDGINARGFRDDNVADASPIVISQSLGLAKQGRYDLSFFVADRTNEDWLHYGVELLAGTNVIFTANSLTLADLLPAGVTGTLAEGVQGDWHSVLLSGNVTAAMSGQPLTLRFFSANANVDQAGGAHNDFALDRIQLSFIAVPEPASMSLLALGCLALASRRARRAQV